MASFLRTAVAAVPGGPITGEDFRDWSERIGDVEEMLDDPELRTEAARIRDRAADARADSSAIPKCPIGTSCRTWSPSRSTN